MITAAIKLSELAKGKPKKITRVAHRGVGDGGDDFDFVSLFGPDLLTKAKGSHSKPTGDLLKGTELIVLYFTASWVEESKTSIDPKLIRFYESATKAKLGVEIILVSSDGIVEEFEEYYAPMPWLSIPTAKGAGAVKTYLATTLGVRKQPSLVVVDARTGEHVAVPNAKRDVLEAVSGEGDGDSAGKKVRAVVDGWKTAKREPLEEAGKPKNPIGRLLMFLVQNPLLLFGIMSAARVLRGRWVQWYLDNNREAGGGGGGTALLEDEFDAAADTEF